MEGMKSVHLSPPQSVHISDIITRGIFLLIVFVVLLWDNEMNNIIRTLDADRRRLKWRRKDESILDIYAICSFLFEFLHKKVGILCPLFLSRTRFDLVISTLIFLTSLFAVWFKKASRNKFLSLWASFFAPSLHNNCASPIIMPLVHSHGTTN